MDNQNNISPYLSIFTDKICRNEIPEEDIAYKFPYELDAFQKEGIYRIYKNENILITAHTGSGKTVLAIYAIAHCLKKNKKVIYTSPTKSLSNQKYAEFVEKFSNDSLLSGSVGIMTGDIKMNPDAQCIIMTTEILRNILYKTSENIQNSSLINIDDIGAVIFDEVHYINDPDRGKVWEETIVLLPSNINLVMLSATIDKPEVFASWVGDIKKIPISLIPTSHRVVPLRHYFWKSHIVQENGKDIIKWNMIDLLDEHGKFKNYYIIKNKYSPQDLNKLMDNLVNYLVDHNYTPALFFKLSRKKCESMCKTVRKNLLTHDEISEVENTFNYYMKDYKKIYEILPQYQDVYNQLKKGVVYHHSGLVPILKEIIEILYTKGLVKILFATETFAIGVNMPTKTVLFSELEKYDNKGVRMLRTDEYLQMSGRAGRRGLDKFGSVILLPTFNLPDEISMKNMMTGKSPSLSSKFKLSYQFVLKIMSTPNFDMDNFLSNTLIVSENKKQLFSIEQHKIVLEKKLDSINIDNELFLIMENYDKICKKIADTFFVVKKKDKDKLEKEKKTIEQLQNFSENYEKYKSISNYKKDLSLLEENIWYNNYGIKDDILKITEVLECEGYISNQKITKKGIVGSVINEVNELLFTEIIFKGFLDKLDFPEIVALISLFINERDQGSSDKYINDLNISYNYKNTYNKIKDLTEYFMDKEDEYKLYIETDYNLYLDFVEPAYIWASGGSIHEVYKNTSVYDGNFIKSIMRINNICENLMDICKTIERYDICSKLENHNEILIRDITSINSLYVK
jgi:superfamily II RNA helicase